LGEGSEESGMGLPVLLYVTQNFCPARVSICPRFIIYAEQWIKGKLKGYGKSKDAAQEIVSCTFFCAKEISIQAKKRKIKARFLLFQSIQIANNQ
jgi:hypothetical protein